MLNQSTDCSVGVYIIIDEINKIIQLMQKKSRNIGPATVRSMERGGLGWGLGVIPSACCDYMYI